MGKAMLFTPVTIGRHTFKNRVFMSPMCLYNSHNQDGMLDKARFDHYTARAASGLGAIVVEATAVCPYAGITMLDLGLYNDAQEAEFKKLVDSVHHYGTKIGIQLGHAGRKGTGYEPIYAPSALKFDSNYALPTPMTTQQVYDFVDTYVDSVKRAYRAGFDFVELHAAHGYLLSSFLSPLTNHRDDEFGGSLENRYRVVHMILERLRAEVDIDVHLRISANEVSEGGNSFEDILQILAWAKADGVVFFDISSGGVTTDLPNPIFPGYQATLSRKVTAAGFRCGAVGLLGSPELAEYVLRAGDAEVIYLGRPLLRNPQWVFEAAKTLHDQPEFVFTSSYPRGYM